MPRERAQTHLRFVHRNRGGSRVPVGFGCGRCHRHCGESPMTRGLPELVHVLRRGSTRLCNVALREPGAHVASPVNGTIVTWRVSTLGTGQYAIRVLRPSGGQYIGAGTSSHLVSSAGMNTFTANLADPGGGPGRPRHSRHHGYEWGQRPLHGDWIDLGLLQSGIYPRRARRRGSKTTTRAKRCSSTPTSSTRTRRSLLRPRHRHRQAVPRRSARRRSTKARLSPPRRRSAKRRRSSAAGGGRGGRRIKFRP